MLTFLKDPEANLAYEVDWTSWLAVGETITSRTVTVPTGLTLVSDSATTGVVTIRVSGGTAGQKYRVECKITTSAGNTDERSFQLDVRER